MYLMEETLLGTRSLNLWDTETYNLVRSSYWCRILHFSPTTRHDSFYDCTHLYMYESTLPGTRSPHLWGSSKHLEYNIFPLFDDSTQIYLTLSLSFVLLSAVPITRIWFLVRSISLLNHQNFISSSSYHLNSASN